MLRARRLHSLVLPLALAMAAEAGPRTFTDSSGREIIAELKSVEGDNVVLKRSDGRVFTIPLATLSEDDRAHAREWKRNRSAEQAAQDAKEQAARLAIERRRKIAEFCERNFRKQVGNGECWTLADEAYKACGASRPGADIRVWGREVDIAKEAMEPGDVVEFRAAHIPGYGTTGPEHTAVVIKGRGRGKCVLAEQNWSGQKTVRTISVDLSGLTSGKLMVYRLE